MYLNLENKANVLQEERQVPAQSQIVEQVLLMLLRSVKPNSGFVRLKIDPS